MKIALQLYTLRNSYQDKEEFKRALLQIKSMGYEGVEFAGFAGLSAKELKEYITEIGLTALSSHHTINELAEKKEEILDYANNLGCTNVVCSYSETNTEEVVEKTITVLEETKKAADNYNITISYHNHSHEFIPQFNGFVPMLEIKKHCRLEVDTYWVFHAGINPMEYLTENKGLIQLVHVKDGDDHGNPCALGEGKNDIASIINTVKNLGMNWIIVENDHPKPNGMEDVQRSINYLKNTFQNQFFEV